MAESVARTKRKYRTRFQEYEYQGRSQTLRAWSEETGIAYEVLRKRLDNGWSVEAALGTALGEIKGHRFELDAKTHKVRVNVSIEPPIIAAIDWMVGQPAKGTRDRPNRSFAINYLTRSALNLPELEASQMAKAKTKALKQRLRLWLRKPRDLATPGKSVGVNVLFDVDVLEQIDKEKDLEVNRRNGLRSLTVNSLLNRILKT